MFILVLPVAFVLLAVYAGIVVFRIRRVGLANPLRPVPVRTWALFVDDASARDARRLARRVGRADDGGKVAVYDLAAEPGLARRLGVAVAPTLVLGDGEGKAKVRLSGTDAIESWLAKRAAP